MLVITRRQHERIILVLPNGQQIAIELLDQRRQSVARIGITAPEDVKIYREEILTKYTGQDAT